MEEAKITKTIDVEKEVMAKISSGQVKLRSKHIFLAERIGFGSVFILSILLAILFFNMLLFYLRASDNIKYLSFGSFGMFAYLETFPYQIVITLICFVFLAAFLLKKIEFAYKRSLGLFSLGLVAFISVAGVILTLTTINEIIERATFAENSHVLFFRPLLRGGLENRQSGVAGRIIYVEPQDITIQTPRDQRQVDIRKINQETKDLLVPGLFVLCVGNQKRDIFEASALKIMDPDEMPMIKRGIHRRFGTDLPDMMPFNLRFPGQTLELF